MAETAVYFDNKEDYATWASGTQSGINKIRKVLEDFPEDVKLIADDTEHVDGEIIVKIPKKWFKNPRPPKKMNLTKEQLDSRALRMKNLHKFKKTVNKESKTNES